MHDVILVAVGKQSCVLVVEVSISALHSERTCTAETFNRALYRAQLTTSDVLESLCVVCFHIWPSGVAESGLHNCHGICLY